MIKPGYKTSEFWFTLVSFLFSGLYLLGIIGDNGQKEDLIRDVSHGVESVILIGGQLALLFRYLNGRKQIKQVYYQNYSPAKADVEPEPEAEKPKNVRKRKTSPKPRARKSDKSK